MEFDLQETGFATKAIHAGNVKDTQYGSLSTPIYQTSTFIFDNCGQGGRRFAGKEDGFIYSRLGNPTQTILEKKMAALENCEDCVAFSSGMGAIASVFWTACKQGSHIVADKTLYGCTFALLEHGLTKFGVETTFVDAADPQELKSALRENTAVVYVETPANPNLKIVDLEEIAKIAHGYNEKIITVVDNTFASPYLQRPKELGFDVIVHSATKYLNGHGDVIAGFALGDAEFMSSVRLFGLKDATGAVIGPFEAFLILRGLKTLELRMDKHCENAAKVAEFLKNHPKIEKVYYPGFPDHQNHEIAKKQMKGFGGMISFILKGGKPAGERLLNSLKLCSLCVSLGDAETLIQHPASMTHSVYTKEELENAGIHEGLVRLSVGLETVGDIISDLDLGLQKA